MHLCLLHAVQFLRVLEGVKPLSCNVWRELAVCRLVGDGQQTSECVGVLCRIDKRCLLPPFILAMHCSPHECCIHVAFSQREVHMTRLKHPRQVKHSSVGIAVVGWKSNATLYPIRLM